MTKNEFLTILRGQLTGKIPTSEVESQIGYYEAYINGQIGLGNSEEAAVEELGDPRLIAKTLIDSTNRAAEEAGYDGPYRSSTDTYDDSDGINSGIFGKSTGNGGAGGTYGQDGFFSGDDDGAAFRGGAQGNGTSGNGTQGSNMMGTGGCWVIIIILVVVLVLIGLLVFSLLRFSIRNFGSIFLIVAIIAGLGLLIRAIGRR